MSTPVSISTTSLNSSIWPFAAFSVPQDPSDESVAAQLSLNDRTRQAMAKRDLGRIPNGKRFWPQKTDGASGPLGNGARWQISSYSSTIAINISPEEFLSESHYHAWMRRGFP